MADFGSPVYNNDAYGDIANLSNHQSQYSLSAGDQAARYSDPFMDERKYQIQRLRNIQDKPMEALNNSPFYKFLIDQQLAAVDAKNRASGHSRDFRGQAALMDRAAGTASQAYFPLLQNATQLAMSGSSPTAAGVTYARGVERSQDQRQMGAAARAAANTPPPAGGGGFNPSLNAFGQPDRGPQPFNPSGGIGTYQPQTYQPSSFGMPYSGGYASGDVMPGYTPSSMAGTGYSMSDYGVQDLSGPGSEYYSFGASQPASAPGYDNYDQQYSDFGNGGDYG